MSRFLEPIAPERAVRLARIGAYCVIAAFAFGAVAFGGFAALASTRAAKEEAKGRTLQKEEERIRSVLAEAKVRSAVGTENQSRAVAAFQETVAKLAESHGCRLAEFLASTDIQPFLTRFEKKSKEQGWSQIEAEITLTGSAQNVFAVLVRLAEQSTPIEFNNLFVGRDNVSASAAVVRAKVQLRILVQAPGGSA